MELLRVIKKEFEGFGKYERILFPFIILFTTGVSLYTNDNKIALISAICGISYTILAGKGRISCYFIGIIGTLCYSYLAYINGFYGNLLLYLFYYLPMEIIGIYKWRKHLIKEKREIVKTCLNLKCRVLYFTVFSFATVVFFFILRYFGAANPAFDSFTTVFSVLGQLLTVKRCIEQWYIWFFVNVFAMLMWISAYINGSNCLATIIMWGVYVVLAIYFLVQWKKNIDCED